MKKLISSTLAALMLLVLFAGCTGGTSSTSSQSGSDSTSQTSSDSTSSDDGGAVEKTTITMPTYRSGEDVGGIFFIPQVERFNQKYEGVYEIIIEESPSNTHTDRIKQLALQDNLPAIFQVSDEDWVRSFLIANDKLQDLSEFVNARPEVKSLLIQDSIDYCTTEDGKLVAMPLTVLRSTGLYYNPQLFEPGKNVTELSWEEFSDALGENVIGYQTAEGGWMVSLILAGIIGSVDGGAEILANAKMSGEKITDFTDPVFIEAFTILQDSFLKHGWNGAIGSTASDAANSFYNNISAVLPDGTWIIDKVYDPTDWGNGFDGNLVVGDYYPGNVAIADPWVFDWMVPANLPENELELAYAFLEFVNSPEEIEAFILAEGGGAPNLTYSDSFTQKLSENSLMTDFATKTNENTTYVPYFNGCIADSLFLGEFSNLLTYLYNGSYTPEQFAQELTEAAQE